MDLALQRTWAGRVVSALTFIVIILFLGIWIFAFLLLRDSGANGSFSQNLLTNLTCVTFFGGIIIAIVAGALIGNFLRRALWKFLIKRRQ